MSKDNKRMTGIVKWFDNKKGYGFATNKDGEYFIHFSEIQQDGYKSLTAGDQISFASSRTERGMKAVNITKEA